MVGAKLVGVLKIETKQRKGPDGTVEVTYFSEQDELVFGLIANSAAIAIENARLSEAERLAEQIRNQPRRLLIALHEFVQGHLWAVDTLINTAGSLRQRMNTLPVRQSSTSMPQSFNPIPVWRDWRASLDGLPSFGNSWMAVRV